MRLPTYLSYSSMTKYHNNCTEFYLQYLCDIRNPRPLQIDYMAVGSGFDAFLKNALHKEIHGKNATIGSDFEVENLYNTQVEEHIRDRIRPVVEEIWDQYQKSGAYAALARDVSASPVEPKMEFRLEEEIGGIPLLGYPDLWYKTPEGTSVICDFKVNGSMSKSGASPTPGFKVVRDPQKSKKHCTPYQARRLKKDPEDKLYKDFTPLQHNDIIINSFYLEDYCEYWASQLCTYAWLLGEPVGSQDFVIRMEQLALRPLKQYDFNQGRYATHMSRISSGYQIKVYQKYQRVWDAVTSGHVFDEMTREESDDECWMLDRRAETPKSLYPQLSNATAPRFYS